MADAAPTLADLHARLKTRQRAERAHTPQDLSLRVHRALSWLGRAAREADDPDIRFILLWVAFNAAYAADLGGERLSTRAELLDYFEKLAKLDGQTRIHAVVWTRYSQEIRILLDSRYVFQPFWAHINGEPGHADWERRLKAEKQHILEALSRRQTARVLRLLFERLYVLRNQMVHAEQPGTDGSIATRCAMAPQSSGPWFRSSSSS